MNQRQNKRERVCVMRRLKGFAGPEEKGEETVMPIICTRHTVRVKERTREQQKNGHTVS